MTRKTIFYGWIIVAVGALSLFFSGPGQTYSISIFIDYYITRFGWSRTAISSFYSIATLISGFSLPFVGRIIDSKGHKVSLIGVSIFFSLTCIWMSMVVAPWMILVGFVFLRMFGQGSLTLIPSVLIPQWFIKKRGKALSLIAVGSILSSAALPPLNRFLIETRGLSFTWLFWAFTLIMIVLPVALFVVKNRPEDIGLLPDGIEYKISGDEIIDLNALEQSWTLDEAKTTRSFWLMMFCMTVPSMINTGITFHMISIVAEKGLDPAFGAYVLSLTALSQTPFNFIAGYLLDKVKVHYVKGFNFLIYAFAIMILITAKTTTALVIYAVVWGLFVGFDSVSSGVLWSNYYGRMHLGKIRGLAMTAMVLGSAFGPLPFGAAYDLFGGYTEVLLIIMILPVLASIASFMSPPPNYDEIQRKVENIN